MGSFWYLLIIAILVAFSFFVYDAINKMAIDIKYIKKNINNK